MKKIKRLPKKSSLDKNFNPDYEYSFWFWQPKLQWILEMLALVIDYTFVNGEIDGIRLSLNDTNNEEPKKWSSGLYYGNKGSMYISMALEAENRDMVNILIASNQIFEEQIIFIDLLQSTYNGFY
jgi:hypothetical protein